MTALLPIPAPTDPDRGRGEAVDDTAASSTASRPRLDPMASCSLDSSDPAERERCADIVPELMTELI
jgi:hypothetical protein